MTVTVSFSFWSTQEYRTIKKLQLIQKFAAGVLTRTRTINAYLKILTLAATVCFCIDFKVLLIVFKALLGRAPDYISEMLLLYEPGSPLRSSRTQICADAYFSHDAPKLQNSLQVDLREVRNQNQLKT